MKYKEITVYTNTFGSEIVADILYSNCCEGVYIYDSNDLFEMIKSDIVWDYVEEGLLVKNEVVRVCGCILASDFDAAYFSICAELLCLSKNAVEAVGSLECTISDIDDQDWLNVWKKYYKPIETKSVVIVPEWINYDNINDKKIVRMNPGMAFGTGEHESTRMCLELLGNVDVKGKQTIDIGAGSGILGIASVVSGADFCAMYDIDPIALDSARENVALNGVENKILIDNVAALDGYPIKADLVFANITADVLISLSKSVSDHMKCGANLILSGIIKSRKSQVEDAYLSAGFSVVESLNQGEWWAFLLTK